MNYSTFILVYINCIKEQQKNFPVYNKKVCNLSKLPMFSVIFLSWYLFLFIFLFLFFPPPAGGLANIFAVFVCCVSQYLTISP